MNRRLESRKSSLPVLPSIDIRKLIEKRRKEPTNEQKLLIKNKALIQQTLRKIKSVQEVSEEELTRTIKWLVKVSKYVPITSNRELEEILRIMILLSQERMKLNELYDHPGLNLMKRVREGMIRYMIVLSELHIHRDEFLEWWFSDEYWISEWSRVLLDLSPDSNMIKYGFANIKARDFLFLLELELAIADDASRIEKPMIRLQPIENKDAFLVIPTEVTAGEYKIQVERILNETVTFTEWINDTLQELNLPK